MSEDNKAPPYFGDEMQAFRNGVQTSMQFGLAVEFVKTDQCVCFTEDGTARDARASVKYAFALAEELVTQGLALGYVAPISDSEEINAQSKKCMRRQIDAQMYQQKIGQRAQKELERSVQVVPGAALNS